MKIITAYTDFDRAFIRGHTAFNYFIDAAKKEPEKMRVLIMSGVSYLCKAATGKENYMDLERAVNVLEGYAVSSAEAIIGRADINPHVRNIRNVLNAGNDSTIYIGIITKNDKYLVEHAVEGLESQLKEKYNVEVLEVHGNDFHKQDGYFNGRMETKIRNNKHEIFGDISFFGDLEDATVYKDASNVHWLAHPQAGKRIVPILSRLLPKPSAIL